MIIHTSKHHTLLFLATISTECSLGKVKRSLEAGEELRAGGIYLMPEAVPCNGILVFAETCAFLNRLMDTSLFRLRMGLLRETNDVYEVINRISSVVPPMLLKDVGISHNNGQSTRETGLVSKSVMCVLPPVAQCQHVQPKLI